MALDRIIDLPEDTSPTGGDYIPIDSSSPNQTRRTSVDNLLTSAGAGIFAATAFAADFVVTVGAGGQFATINAALAFLSQGYGPRYKQSGLTAELNLLTGFVMTEQVIGQDVDLGWITITSADAEVVISREALTEPVDVIYYPAFSMLGPRGVMPKIKTLFNMDTSGAVATYKNGIFISNGARGYIFPNYGVKNASGRGLHIANGGACIARSTNFSGAGEAAVRNGSGFVEVRQSNLQNSGKGLMVAGGSVTDAEDANLSGCVIGIENYDSTVRFGTGIANNCGTGAYVENGRLGADFASFNGATVRGIEARLGSQVNLRTATIDNCAGIALFVSASNATAPNLSALNAVGGAVYAVGRSDIDVNTSILTGSTGYAILAQQGAFVNAQAADATGATISGFRAQDGSFINARAATGTVHGTNVPNTFSANGAVFTTTVAPWSTGLTSFSPSTDNTHDIGTTTERVRRAHVVDLRLGTAAVTRVLASTGSPESVYSAPVGSRYFRENGTAGNQDYIKESGTGATGWACTGDFSAETTAANIAAIGNALNTTDKRKGKIVWDTTNNRAMRASGTTAASPWHALDGSVTVTPS